MIGRFRTKHIKKVLWVLVFIIVPAFVLWGSASLFREKAPPLGEIEGKKIAKSEFLDYYNLAGFFFMLTYGKDFDRYVRHEDITEKAWELLLLLRKAQKENIHPSDGELRQRIKKRFFGNRKFKKELYYRGVKRAFGVEPRTFEELMRKVITVEKLIDTYLEDVRVSDEEVKRLYKKHHEKAKIAYILIPYEDFKEEVTATTDEITHFYETHNEDFRVKPKVKIKYVFFKEENVSKEYLNDIDTELKKIKSIDALKDAFSVIIKESDYISKESPLESIGWNRTINELAFSLGKNQISPIIKVDEKGYVIIQKIDERESFIPPLKEIENEAKAALLEQKTKTKAERFALEALKKITEENISDLEKVAKPLSLEVTETDYFKYYDYIEGVGLGEEISKAIFRLKKDQIYKKPFLLSKGTYIIQLIDFIPIDEAKFEEEKESYRQTLLHTRKESTYQLLKANLINELNLKIFASPQR